MPITINAFAVNVSNHSIPSIALRYSAEVYKKHVKQLLKAFLEDPSKPIIYLTMIDKTHYMTHITGLNTEIDSLDRYLDQIRSYAEYEEHSSITLNSSGAHIILERGFYKRMLSLGWTCRYRYGYYECYRKDEVLGESEVKQTSAPWLFTFYRSYVFKVVPIEDRLYFVVEPKLYVKGASFKDLVERVGLERIKNELETRKEGIECIAYRDSEDKYRNAIAEGFENTTKGLMVKIIYFDGEQALVKPDKVRLKGNVLYFKSFISRIFGGETYRIYSKLHRSYSFSLGTKESDFKMAEDFKREVAEFINRIRRDKVIPLTLGGVSVDLDNEPVKVEVATYEL